MQQLQPMPASRKDSFRAVLRRAWDSDLAWSYRRSPVAILASLTTFAILLLALLAMPWLVAAHALAEWSWPGAQAVLQRTGPDGWRLIAAWDVWYRVPLLLVLMATALSWLRCLRRGSGRSRWPSAVGEGTMRQGH